MKHDKWYGILDLYWKMNEGRPTRIGVFEKGERDSFNDYWIEDGLPLAGLATEVHDGVRSVQMMVGQMTHEVRSAVSISFHLGLDGADDGIDIKAADGHVTILRFENAS